MAETWKMDDEEKPLVFGYADKFLFVNEQKANSPRMERHWRK